MPRIERFFSGTNVSDWTSGAFGAAAEPAFAYATTGSPTLRSYSGYQSLTWTSSGTITPTAVPTSLRFDIWIVSGGGGGTGGYCGGGGGAGGAMIFPLQGLTVGESVITIGAGGAGTDEGGIGSITTLQVFEASLLKSRGGGTGGTNRGASYLFLNGQVGGSGGGATGSYQARDGSAGIAGEGERGGTGDGYYTVDGAAGGGGGKGGVGQNGVPSTGSSADGVGGNGGAYGTNVYADGTTSGVGVGQFAGGGGGGGASVGSTGGSATGGGGAGGNAGTGSAGTAGTGGGGGGGVTNGGTGGGGVVVIRWAV